MRTSTSLWFGPNQAEVHVRILRLHSQWPPWQNGVMCALRLAQCGFDSLWWQSFLPTGPGAPSASFGGPKCLVCLHYDPALDRGGSKLSIPILTKSQKISYFSTLEIWKPYFGIMHIRGQLYIQIVIFEVLRVVLWESKRNRAGTLQPTVYRFKKFTLHRLVVRLYIFIGELFYY